jgi:hypothetical protein
VQFFLERARAARREVRFEPAVTDICRRLDGFPLALELAAASLLTLNAAGERLERGEDLDAIRSSAEDALGELRSIADPYGVASALDLLGHIALRGGDTEAACAYIRESIDLSRPIDDRQSLTSTLVFAAAAAFARGDAVVSTQLWDAYEGLCDVYGFGSELEPWLDDVRAEARKAAAKRAGASTDLDLDAAIDLALSAVAV